MKRIWMTSLFVAGLVSVLGIATVHASGGGGGERGEENERGEGGERGGEGEGGERLAGFPGSGPEAARQIQTYREACGDCHVAYPPQLLDAAQWQQLMGKLEQHFGDRATLTAPTLNAVTAYLTTHAARTGSVSVDAASDLPRISRSRWFVDEHSELAADVWQREAVGSAANCTACHRQAADGRYDEDGVHVPR